MNKKILIIMFLGMFMISMSFATLTNNIDSYYKFDDNSFADATSTYADSTNSGTTNITGIITH